MPVVQRASSGVSVPSGCNGRALAWFALCTLSERLLPVSVMSASVPVQSWFPSGLDVVRDGIWGRFGVSPQFGDTIVSGSIEGLAVQQDPLSGRIHLYAGASNGGVRLRVYDPLSGDWSPRWQWLSAPGTGYEGSQSIGALAVSADGGILAVGQGNPSNKASIAAPSQGVRLGRIAADGSIDWLAISDDARRVLAGQAIRSLRWQGSSLLATSWNAGAASNGRLLRLQTDASGIQSVLPIELPFGVWELAGQGSDNLVAGYDAEGRNRIALVSDLQSLPLQGEVYTDLIAALASEGLRITRISLHPQRLQRNGQPQGVLVAFISSAAAPTASLPNAYVHRIDRLEIDPGSRQLLDLETYTTQALLETDESGNNVFLNSIGDNQALNSGRYSYYGNVAFAADPNDPEARTVYVGGNHYADSSDSLAMTYAGGLVSVRFDGERGAIANFLYGLRIKDPLTDQAALVTPFTPGQPHADSRRIVFADTPSGPILIQSDDGGVWQLQLDSTRPGAALPDVSWNSLSATGLNTMELNMVDWSAVSNSIASSYQDNGASLGYFGDDNATNVWWGDGEIAISDDAASREPFVTYLSSQLYILSGLVVGLGLDSSGFIQSSNAIDFYLQQPGRAPIPWQATAEARKSSAPFLLPIEANAYRRESIVMAGQLNAYESIAISPKGLPNTIVFEPLLGNNLEAMIFTAIDHQGSAGQGAISSLYLAGQQGSGGRVSSLLYGRQSNDSGQRQLTLLKDFSQVDNGLAANAPIIDLAHAPTSGGADRVYVLQGGKPVLYFSGAISSNGAAQKLNILQPDGTLIWLDLEPLGIQLTPDDAFGLQSLVYVPQTPAHTDRLVISGLSGQWMSELDDNGLPTGFVALPWQGLPAGQAPGAPLAMTKYDPEDDLLITGLQGMGSWIYSFTGDLGDRPAPTTLLQVADTTLIQRTVADLDKRSNQVNQNLFIQLDGRLRDPAKPEDVLIRFHDAAAWRRWMETVSPFSESLRQSFPLEALQNAYLEAFDLLNILTPEGLAFIGGREVDGDLVLPFSFIPDVNTYGMTINAKEFPYPQPDITLDYSVSTADGRESVRRTLTLLSDPDASVVVSGAELISFTLLNISELTAAQQQQIQQRNAELALTTGAFLDTWNLRPDSPSLRPVVLSVPFSDLLLAAPGADGTAFHVNTQVLYGRDSDGAIVSASAEGYDSQARTGFRFYDLSGDGTADHFTLTAPGEAVDAVNDRLATPGLVLLDPSISTLSLNRLQVGDDSRSDRISLRLASTLLQRASSVSQIGVLLLEPGERLEALTPAAFKERALILFSSLGPRQDALPAGSRFEQEILIGNGQQLMLFQAEGTTISGLSGPDDPRLLWFESQGASTPQQLELATSDGTRLGLELRRGVQGLDALTGDLQDQAPLLDLTAIAPLRNAVFELGLGREAEFDSVCGFYVVQNAAGVVQTADGRFIAPGDPSYREQALREDNLCAPLADLQVADGETRQTTVSLAGGVILAPYARVNGEVYFHYADANNDQQQHFLSLGNNLIGFEDLPNLGDDDLNDLVIALRALPF